MIALPFPELWELIRGLKAYSNPRNGYSKISESQEELQHYNVCNTGDILTCLGCTTYGFEKLTHN